VCRAVEKHDKEEDPKGIYIYIRLLTILDCDHMET
jgi:hypothetical protein